jgi:beta-fructofuranosidase
LLTAGFILAIMASAGVVGDTTDSTTEIVAQLSDSFAWTDDMLTWQRTAFHFQPAKNWMNDPNGPLYYKGWYHLFYQYNPEAPVWGNITWGHTVSKDLIHWHHLPNAMYPDQPYDIGGVWTGSATILPDGQIIMIYTGISEDSAEVQNIAYPANLSDPLLIDWVKYDNNPVLVPPPGIGVRDFRDPSTAWRASEDDKWRIAIGSKLNQTGFSLVYETSDFKNFELLDGWLHSVPDTGIWECVDFYPVSKLGENGLDTSVDGPGVKHVMKASLWNEGNDYYSIGFYDADSGKWSPDDHTVDIGQLRYDYGTFYASKTFYDHVKSRRILWSWIKELDSENTDKRKGWASLMGIPRTILFDRKTGSNLLQWPVQEIESLRLESKEFLKVKVNPGSVLPLEVGSADQV